VWTRRGWKRVQASIARAGHTGQAGRFSATQGGGLEGTCSKLLRINSRYVAGRESSADPRPGYQSMDNGCCSVAKTRWPGSYSIGCAPTQRN
jgi:hypothetical protein